MQNKDFEIINILNNPEDAANRVGQLMMKLPNKTANATFRKPPKVPAVSMKAKGSNDIVDKKVKLITVDRQLSEDQENERLYKTNSV